jgi:hypothetical protein
MLLAFSAKAEEIEVLMLSLTFGNVEVQKYDSPLRPHLRPPLNPTCADSICLAQLLEECGYGVPSYREGEGVAQREWKA